MEKENSSSEEEEKISTEDVYKGPFLVKCEQDTKRDNTDEDSCEPPIDENDQNLTKKEDASVPKLKDLNASGMPFKTDQQGKRKFELEEEDCTSKKKICEENSVINKDKENSRNFAIFPKGAKENNACEDEELKDTICTRAHEFKESESGFFQAYQNWLPLREKTLSTLRALLDDLRNTQRSYNKTQVISKSMSVGSVLVEHLITGGVAENFALVLRHLNDLYKIVTSVSHVRTIDFYQETIKKIVDLDRKATAIVYETRSQFVAKYNNIEEVMRKFDANTFDTNAKNIFGILQVNKFLKLVEISREIDASKFLNILRKFISNACQPQNIQSIYDSITEYNDINPAASDAVGAFGRAAFGVMKWQLNKNNGYEKLISDIIDGIFLIKDVAEIGQYLITTDESAPPTKLEAKLEEIIGFLEDGRNELTNSYEEVRQSDTTDANDI